MLAGMRLLLLFGGLGLILLGVRGCQLAGMAQDEPQTLTCAELGTAGPGDNVHVRMREFLLLEHAFVVKERFNTWAEVWVPAVPAGGAYHQAAVAAAEQGGDDAPMPPLRELHVIVKLTDVETDEDLSAKGKLDALQGLVINEVDPLEDDQIEVLEQSYPGIEFSKCWVLEAGREPQGIGSTLLFVGGGALAILVGLASLIGRLIKASEDTDDKA